MFLDNRRGRSTIDPCNRKFTHQGVLEAGGLKAAHGITCLLCEAVVSSVAQLENHLTTAHHVTESCVRNVLLLSSSRVEDQEIVDQQGSVLSERNHQLNSDCDAPENGGSPLTGAATTFTSERRSSTDVQWHPSRRHHSSAHHHHHYSPYLITGGGNELRQKRTSSSNHFRSRLTNRDIERIQSFVASNACSVQDLKSLAVELGKSVQTIYNWLQENHFAAPAADRTNGGAFPQVWPVPPKSNSVASSDSFIESISPISSNECHAATTTTTTMVANDPIEQEVTAVLRRILDKVANGHMEYVGLANGGGGEDRRQYSTTKRSSHNGFNSRQQQTTSFMPKQIRTNILPEQQEILMKKFQADCNPPRQDLEKIAEEVGLRKRVVQVWFQNTRARERRSAQARLQSFQASPAAAWFAAVAAAAASNGLTASMSTLAADFAGNRCSDDGRRVHDDFGRHDDSASADFIPNKAIKIEQRSCSSSPPPPAKQFWPSEKPDAAKDCGGESYALDCTMPNGRYLRSQGQTACCRQQRAPPTFLANTSGMSPVQNGTGVVRRFRTQMSPLQVRIMKAIFIDYKTPTMPECEALGREIGLQKRVVQVWFQNARAKEKKNPNHIRLELSKLISGPASVLFSEGAGSSSSGCPLCSIRYDGFSHVQRDHLFSSAHINSLRECFLSSCKQDSLRGVKIEMDAVGGESNCSSMKLESSTSPGPDDTVAKSHQSLPAESGGSSKLAIPPTAVYDPDIHGTPLRLLRIPLLGLSHIAKMIQDDASIAQYTDDSSSSSELLRMGFRVYPVSIDVGFVCKPCQLAWPRFHACFKHVRQHHHSGGEDEAAVDSPDSDDSISSHYRNFILKIEQLLHRCESCGDSFGTLSEFLQHARSTGCGQRKRPVTNGGVGGATTTAVSPTRHEK